MPFGRVLSTMTVHANRAPASIICSADTPKVGPDQTGVLINSGTSEWVAGLIHRDWFVERVTRTVLDRLGGSLP